MNFESFEEATAGDYTDISAGSAKLVHGEIHTVSQVLHVLQTALSTAVCRSSNTYWWSLERLLISLTCADSLEVYI